MWDDFHGASSQQRDPSVSFFRFGQLVWRRGGPSGHHPTSLTHYHCQKQSAIQLISVQNKYSDSCWIMVDIFANIRQFLNSQFLARNITVYVVHSKGYGGVSLLPDRYSDLQLSKHIWGRNVWHKRWCASSSLAMFNECRTFCRKWLPQTYAKESPPSSRPSKKPPCDIFSAFSTSKSGRRRMEFSGNCAQVRVAFKITLPGLICVAVASHLSVTLQLHLECVSRHFFNTICWPLKNETVIVR
jgi:hypothetical protein